jgi:hypothetical protein
LLNGAVEGDGRHGHHDIGGGAVALTGSNASYAEAFSGFAGQHVSVGDQQVHQFIHVAADNFLAIGLRGNEALFS